jgi:hypothetical protein
LDIKVTALITVFVLVGSILASAEVDDKSPTGEMKTGDSSFAASGASLVDMNTGSYGEDSYGTGSQGADSYASSQDGMFVKGSGNNKIWILDPTCSKRYLDLSRPFGLLAVLELAPDASGYAMLFHRLPSGELQTEYMGYIYRGHRYKISLCANSIGTHEMWYRIGWQESNRVMLDVCQGLQPL